MRNRMIADDRMGASMQNGTGTGRWLFREPGNRRNGYPNSRRAMRVFAALGVWGLGFALSAGTLSIVDIPATGSDTNVINPGKVYTHALRFGVETGLLWINGVPFAKVNTATGTGYSYTNAGTFNTNAGNANTHADGNMNVLLTSMFYFNGNANPVVLTLSGLTPGVKYSTRVYYRPWTDSSTRNETVTFNGDGTDSSIVVNEDAGAAAHYLQYDFTASGSIVTFSTTPASVGVNWHLYGVTTEETVIPPPATLSIKDIPATGSDAGSGISASRTYTHALSFGDSTGTLIINGVSFTEVNTAMGTGYSYTNASTFTAHAGNANTHADGNMSVLLTGMFYFSGNTDPVVLTLSGLTPGMKYSTRVYYRPWTDGATRNETVTFNGNGASTSYTTPPTYLNEDAGATAHYLQYDFTARGSTVTFWTTPQSGGTPWHLYGVSTEVIRPPSGTIFSFH